MLTKKTIIDVDLISQEQSILVIKQKTGVFYNMQAGGTACAHPEFEGYAIPLFDFAQDFDSCSFGCSYIHYDIETQTEMMQAFDEHISKLTSFTFRIKADWDSVGESMEAVFPVIVNGKIGDTKFNNAKAILYTCNCD